MKALRQMGGGFIIAIVSILLVIGGISLSLAETFAPSLPPTPSPLPTTFAVEFASPLPTSTLPPALPTDTLAPPPTAAAQPLCIIPPGWVSIIVGANDTLYTIAERYKTTAETLNQANCLNNLPPAVGATLYVPPVPTVTVIPCGPPAGWVRTHLVQPGENLYRISLLYRTTVALLQSANCMGASTLIHAGQLLWVPNVPTSTPAVTATPFNTNTPLPFTDTPTPTITPDFGTPTLTATNPPAPTSTPSPTPSLTPFPSSTPSQ
jgi:LysM repeat protein